MFKFIANLERKIGKYAIKNLPLYMLILYAIGYIMQIINPNISYVLSLNPYAILHGQVWRLFTWLLMPPDSSNLFFMLVALYFYYSIGSSLERTWGTFFFNYYIFTGIIFTIIGAFAFYFYSYLFRADVIVATDAYFATAYGTASTLYGGSWYYALCSASFSTYYINMSIFLAFAATFPNVEILLFFILPIKVKALGIIYAILIVIDGFNMGVDGLFVVGASLLNFVLFFISSRKLLKNKSSSFQNRKRDFKVKQTEVKHMKPSSVSKHKCAICGRTDESNPELQFRFCSKCQGNYEFCQDHLFNHKHFERK